VCCLALLLASHRACDAADADAPAAAAEAC
jgi:hypothetical protein